MNNEHVLLCVIGRSASGKDTLVNHLCETEHYNKILSYATRPQREGETNTHIFVDESVYHQMKTENKVAIETKIGDYYYWTTINQLYENDIYIVDAIGLKMIKDNPLPNLRVVSVYINTPDEIRLQRATKNRKDDIDKFRKRDLDERQQFRSFLQNAEFDWAVSNKDFANAYSVFRWICDVEGLWKNKEDNNGNQL